MPASTWQWGPAVAVVVLLGVAGCGDDEPEPLSTEACPAPTSATGDGDGGAAVSATGEYRGDLPRGSGGRLVVNLDDGRGSPATTVSPCQKAQLELDLSPAAVTVSPGRFTVTSTEGSGQLSFVDQETVIDEYAAAGYAAGSYAQLTGWYVTVDDPAPGEYVVVRDVVWSQQLNEREGEQRAAGTVTVTLTIT